MKENIKRWKGKIKEYDNDKNFIEFEGELVNGCRNGKGKAYSDNRLIYEGEFLNGNRHGKGKEYFDSIEIYHIFIKNKK